MSEEVQSLAEVESATTPEATAASEHESRSPESAESVESPSEKRFTQSELDEIIGKRLAREQRKWEREQQARMAEPQPAERPSEPLSLEQFDSIEAYADAVAEAKAAELVREREHRQRSREIDNAYAEREEAARSRYNDFELVAYNRDLPITEAMAETIKVSDIGPDIAYWLGSNLSEADRISRLPPLLQAREIGKIEASLIAQPPKKKTSSAPDPITPVTARAVNPGVVDTTDPRSTQTMSTDEWIKAERQRVMDKAKANQIR